MQMNLRNVILKEHSKKQALKVADYVGESKTRFFELMNLFLGKEYRVTQRAAWAVSICVERHPDLLEPWLRKMILNLSKKGLPDAVKRNTVRILQSVSIPKQFQGITAQSCFKLLLSPDEPVAVKVFSMSVLCNLCKEEPALRHELKLIIEAQLPYGSAGYKSRAGKILKTLSVLKDE